MAVLFFHAMRYKPQDPRNPHNDRFVLSKVGDQPATLHLGLGVMWAPDGWEDAGSEPSPPSSPQAPVQT